MPSTVDSSCFRRSYNRSLSDSCEEKKIFKTKVDILNCKPEDVSLKVDGNRVIIEGKLFKNNKSKEKPVYFSKHYIMPENCEIDKMQYTITPDGVYITAPKREKFSTEWPKLEDNCTTNCIDLKDKFEIRLNVQEFKPEDIKVKVNGNTITVKAKQLQETGMRRVIKTYSLPDSCEITKLERKFTPEGNLILTIPKFLGLFYDSNNKKNVNETKTNVKCKFNITAEKFEIKLDVANFRPEDINIIQQKRLVTIEGKRCKKLENISFEKSFVLPGDYDTRKIDRKFHSDGILVITIPRIKGKPMEDFKTFLPENAICDMQIKEDYVEIKLDLVGFSPEEITIKITCKNTLTLEGKQIGRSGKINKSFMKSYILPSECDTRRIKKHITPNGVLIVRIPRKGRSCSLENLADLSEEIVLGNGTKTSSLDNLSEPEDQAMVNSAELDKEKFEMKFNVKGFQTEDIYVKINKNVVKIECRHSDPGRSIFKSYLVPRDFDLNALQTYITHDDILFVTIPRLKSQFNEPFLLDNNNNRLYYTQGNNPNKYSSEKIGDNYVIKIDIRGYNNNDISLDIKGQNVLVQGGHLGNRTISRSFSKSFEIPPNYSVEKLIYYISAGGFLNIEIPQKMTHQSEVSPKSYSFPTNTKGNSSLPDELTQYNKRSSNNLIKSSPIPENSTKIQKYNNNNTIYNCPKESENRKFNKITFKSSESGVEKEGVVIFDDEDNELYLMEIDVSHCHEKDINVRIKGHNLRVEGKKQFYDGDNTDTSQDFSRDYTVPEQFNMKGIATRLEGGMLFITIPKYVCEKPTQQVALAPKGADILSNVKIGTEYINVEMDASGLRIEDFGITTNKNILTIVVSKENCGALDKFKTKVDLPEDSLIDEISKIITPEGKLIVTIPRKIQDIVVPTDINESSKFIESEKRSCLLVSKPNMGQKSKSVKFLVDDFESESDGAIKFATLPRSVRSKSYNSLYRDTSDNTTSSGIIDQNFELKIFVPHHEPDEVIVKIRGNTITIEGKKKDDKGNTYFSKNFFKTYIVPKNIDTAQLKTTFSSSYLIITAPKKGEDDLAQNKPNM